MHYSLAFLFFSKVLVSVSLKTMFSGVIMSWIINLTTNDKNYVMVLQGLES